MYIGTKYAHQYNLLAIDEGDIKWRISDLIFYNIHVILFVSIIVHTRRALGHMVVECICVHVEFSSRERKWCVEELEKVYDHGQYGRESC